MTSFWSTPAQLTESNRKRTRTSSLSSRPEVGVMSETSLLSIGPLPVAPAEMASVRGNVVEIVMTSSRSGIFSDRQLSMTSRQEESSVATSAFNDGDSTTDTLLPVFTSRACTVGRADVVISQSRRRRDVSGESMREIAARGPTSGDEGSSRRDPSTMIRIELLALGLVVPLLISSCDLRRICAEHTPQSSLLAKSCAHAFRNNNNNNNELLLYYYYCYCYSHCYCYYYY